VSFQLDRHGERVRGLAKGVDKAHLERLARGQVEIDLDLDLHGLREAEARQLVRATLREAYEDGDRCVRVIHGRGRHSEIDAVLKDAFPGWLAESPTDRIVMAFSTALPRDGGTGASYVLLRRRRA